MRTAKEFIKNYMLTPHPEGGHFYQTHKSACSVKASDPRFNNETRSASTAIYYLLDGKEVSKWHSLKSDEIWHFYYGGGLKLYSLDNRGNLTTQLLGNPTQIAEASFQVIIKAGDYFAAENIDKNSFSFIGCTVSPGFEYQDFNLIDKNVLIALFPKHQTIIEHIAKLKSS